MTQNSAGIPTPNIMPFCAALERPEGPDFECGHIVCELVAFSNSQIIPFASQEPQSGTLQANWRLELRYPSTKLGGTKAVEITEQRDDDDA